MESDTAHDARPRGLGETPSSPASSSGPRQRKLCDECGSRFGTESTFCPFDGAKLTPAPWDSTSDPLIGQLIDGRYEVDALLGEGGMGKVYRVRHRALDRTFATKILRHDVARDQQLAERFIQEARATASIKHPNVVSITDFGRLRDDTPYFVMELLVGGTLASLLKKGPLAMNVALPIALKVAHALSAAHAVGVIHRDLKPENIFLLDLRPDGSPRDLRLVDFGAAQVMGKSRLTKKGIVFGTPHYMSPEQAAGGAVDHRADIYALGVILYEMFSGKVPFDADTYMGVLTQHMYVEPKPLREVCGGEIGPIEEVTMRALEKDPARRYPSMAALIEAIEASTKSADRELPSVPGSGLEGVDRPAPSGARVRPLTGAFTRELRLRRMSIMAIVCVVAITAIVVIAIHGVPPPVAPRAALAPNPTSILAAAASATAPVADPTSSVATASSSVPVAASASMSSPVADGDRPVTRKSAPHVVATSAAPPSAPPSATSSAAAKPKHLGDFQDPWSN